MFEMMISLPGAWGALGELGAAVNGAAGGGDGWVVPPHAVSAAAERTAAEINIVM